MVGIWKEAAAPTLNDADFKCSHASESASHPYDADYVRYKSITLVKFLPSVVISR